METAEFTAQSYVTLVRSNGEVATLVQTGTGRKYVCEDVTVEEACAMASALMQAACYSATKTTESLANALGNVPEMTEQMRKTSKAIEEQVSRFAATADELTSKE